MAKLSLVNLKQKILDNITLKTQTGTITPDDVGDPLTDVADSFLHLDSPPNDALQTYGLLVRDISVATIAAAIRDGLEKATQVNISGALYTREWTSFYPRENEQDVEYAFYTNLVQNVFSQLAGRRNHIYNAWPENPANAPAPFAVKLTPSRYKFGGRFSFATPGTAPEPTVVLNFVEIDEIPYDLTYIQLPGTRAEYVRTSVRIIFVPQKPTITTIEAP